MNDANPEECCAPILWLGSMWVQGITLPPPTTLTPLKRRTRKYTRNKPAYSFSLYGTRLPKSRPFARRFPSPPG